MRLLRRFIIALLLVTAATILIFGPRAGAKIPPGRKVITYWEKWSGREGIQMQQIVDDFNNSVGKEKGIFVQYLSMPNVNQKTLVATAAGVPPDVAGLWDANIVQFAAADALEPLDELVKQYGLTRDYYKPVYYDGGIYKGTLWALPSTPMATALHWNKRMFQAKAAELRAAGLDPDRAPRTIAEFDRYSAILDTFEQRPSGRKRVVRAGHLPMEPTWYVNLLPYWWGGDLFDPQSQQLTLLDPRTIECMRWIRSYSEKLGKDSLTEFKSGLSGFNTTQNAFLTGEVAMVLQGPWMANYIENLRPPMNHVKWTKEEEAAQPRAKRRENYEWGAAPFPSAVPGMENVSYCAFDVLSIPRGARHKKEAFEFIAYVQRQDVMEKVCMLHCKNSPLAKVSDNYLEHHPNPYIEVFDMLAASPNAKSTPRIPIWQELNQEVDVAVQRVYLLQQTPEEAMRVAQSRVDKKWDDYRAIQAARHAPQVASGETK